MIQEDILKSLSTLQDVPRDKIRNITIATEYILKHALVQFNDEVFKQTKGMPMGTNAAVQLANLYVYCFIESNENVKKYIQTKCFFYKRYIDDIFFIWNGSRMELEDFITLLNQTHLGLKFTGTISENTVPFLDLEISLANNQISTKTYQKALNKYLYIPMSSCHPISSKKGFIKGEFIRYIRNSSTVEDFVITANLFTDRLLQRGYSRKFISEAVSNISYKLRDKYLDGANQGPPINLDEHTIYFKIRYHPYIDKLKLNSILNEDTQRLENDLKFKAMVVYKKSKNIAELVTSSRYSTNTNHNKKMRHT